MFTLVTMDHDHRLRNEWQSHFVLNKLINNKINHVRKKHEKETCNLTILGVDNVVGHPYFVARQPTQVEYTKNNDDRYGN